MRKGDPMTDTVGRTMPLLGDAFPEMTVKTTHGVKNLPADYSGRWFVLFSHPGDFTPVCTTEFYSFAKRADQFAALNAELIGMSVDQVFSHIKWADWIHEKLGLEIPFPIIADTGAVAEKLGMIHPGLGSNTVRAVFVVDDTGTLRWMVYYPQEVGRNVDEILRSLRALQIATANKVAMPADWPNNDLLGDRVIVPPAQTVADARRRAEEYECYDWWFCHKQLEE
jgi:peroxiredoxin (alkyl hydroperoxide reductase subunit C)